MKAELSFCIVVPMYNEEAGAERCVRTVCKALDALPPRSALVVVNDGSTDSTGDILRRLAPDYESLAVVEHERNRGYGGALKTGADKAAAEGFQYVLFMDSDLTNDPAEIPKFAARMQEGFDVIKASRYCPGGAVQGVPWWRVVISVVGNRLARWLYGLPLSDCTNGYRAVKVGILKKMPLEETGFAVIMEELYYAKHLARTFCEVPYTLTDRSDDQRASSFSYSPQMFYRYLKYPLKTFLHRYPKSFLEAVAHLDG